MWAILLLAASGRAWAQQKPPGRPVDEAEVLIRQGVNRRDLGDNQGAYRIFQQAYNLRRTPRTAAHLGSSEYDIGLWVDSEVHITEALRGADDPWINASRVSLIGVLNNLRMVLGRLEVVGRPAGAEVEVAGRSVGYLPLEGPLRVVKGELVVRVTSAGYRPFQRTVKVTANGLAQVVVELDRLAPGQSAAAPTLGPAVRPNGPFGEARSREPDLPPGALHDQATAESDWRVPAAWASAGVATLLAAGGIVGAVVSYSNTKRFNDFRQAPNTMNKMCNQAAPDAGGGKCPGWLSASQTSRTLAIASGVGAAVAAVAAVVFFGTARDASDRAGLSCTTTRGEPEAACGWRF